jgi:hypothetical protein
MRPAIAKRLADGFRMNKGNVWGHCEEPLCLGSSKYPCTDQTRYRCEKCGSFVCADHQSQHRKECNATRSEAGEKR